MEIPLVIVKSSVESRERKYKCTVCEEVIDRLFMYEDHWLHHLLDGFKQNATASFQRVSSVQSFQREPEAQIKCENLNTASDYNINESNEGNIFALKAKVLKEQVSMYI